MRDPLIVRFLLQLQERLPTWPLNDKEQVRLPFADERCNWFEAIEATRAQARNDRSGYSAILGVAFRATRFESQGVQHAHLMIGHVRSSHSRI